MIVEGICTTRNPDGSINIAPMGPVVDEQQTTFLFRPFQTSTTFANLQRNRVGVFHIVDDVALIAEAAVGKVISTPETVPAKTISGDVLKNCCRWFEFEVTQIDDSNLRTEISTKILHTERRRDFWGFNRAKHAVLETAILATRLHLIPRSEIESQIQILESSVLKTGGTVEVEAFEFLKKYIKNFETASLNS